MGIELLLGLIVGAFLIYAGYLARSQKVFSFLAGYSESWEPVNREKLGNRVGSILIMIGIITILGAIFTIWFGSIIGKIIGILVIIAAILVLLAVGLDQIGY